MLEETSDICYREIKDIKCIICPHKPEGSMFVMVSNILNNVVSGQIFKNVCNMKKKEIQKLRIVRAFGTRK